MIDAQVAGKDETTNLKITHAVFADYRWGMTACYYSITVVALSGLREPLPPQIRYGASTMSLWIPDMSFGGWQVARGLFTEPYAIELPKVYIKTSGRLIQYSATESGHRLDWMRKEWFDE
jgi:hypothetical protein